jgi:hypothetical protein
MENRIKEAQQDMFADRLSTHHFRGNQLRLWLWSFTYVLVEAIRRWGLQDTELANATAGTIRLKLLKMVRSSGLSHARQKRLFSLNLS